MLNFNAQIKCEDLSILFQQTWTNITVPGVQAVSPSSSDCVGP